MRKRNVARRTSIVDSFHEPALRTQVLINSIQCSLVFTIPREFRSNLGTYRPYLDVPLLARPCRFRPPLTFSFPWSREREDLPANTLATDKRRLSVLKFHVRRKWRPVNAHHSSSLLFSVSGFFSHF